MRRYVSPVLRLLLALFILALPLLLAALAQAEESAPRALVTLRPVTLGARPRERTPSGPRLGASAPATRVDGKDGALLVEASVAGRTVRGWADASAFLALDDPATTVSSLVEEARLFLAQGDRTVLAIAVASEAARRDAASVEAWSVLGASAERLASTCPSGSEDSCIARGRLFGVGLVRGERGLKYDGEAYRRVLALAPSPEVAEETRLKLLASGREVGPESGDEAALSRRAGEIGELLTSFPSTRRRVPLLLERARLLAAAAHARGKAGRAAEADAARDAAIEAASEVAATAEEPARRRAADRLLLRLTRSFPRAIASERPVVSARGARAAFVARGGRSFLEVHQPDGRLLVQPYPVASPDPATLAFDPSGTRVAWDEVPRLGRRTTRLLDLSAARVTSPAAAAEGEVVRIGGAEDAESRSDRYTSFVSFSPDGASLLVVTEGFSADGARLPRRHVLCDVEGRRGPRVVAHPFSAPGAVDWERLARAAETSG
ncbi:MAG TPA: hypothetical protein VKF32_03390 [Thermoanaerobaculia bacterium]|nr:hypothetical protein [Thermoanaerobaculia bacterium]